jgi:Uma2 family endonuclease
MVATPQPAKMTVDAYLAWEPCQELRYEYVNGDVLAMTGGTLPHNDIALNVYAALRPYLRVKNCRGNVVDAKVQVTPTLYRYPDVVTSCDERDLTALKAICYPNLIVEVLSPGTEALDRGQKFEEYRTLPSLQAYVLVSAETLRVEVYRRGEGRLWLYSPYQRGDTLSLDFLGFECAIEQFYEGVTEVLLG